MSSDSPSAVDSGSDSAGSGIDLLLVVDRTFQLAILRRVGAYALIGMVYLVAISLATDSMADPAFSWESIWTTFADEAVCWAPGLLFIVPALAIDLLRLTRRFASPVNRLGAEMQLLIDGKSETPLAFDAGDGWMQLASQFNELREELLELRQAKMLAKGRTTAFAGPVIPEPTLKIFSKQASRSSEVLEPDEELVAADA